MENSEQQAFANEYHCGLSKREYFAGLAMQGLLANTTQFSLNITNDSIVWATIASIKIADELLKQLENEK